jgi:predicted XRE-type DNA-binding protein
MARIKSVTVHTPHQLAAILGLSPTDAVELQVRRRINDKLIEAVRKSGLSHVQVAKAAKTSRARLTAILNRNTSQVSTDLMLRILATLGYEAKVAFTRIRRAA